MIRTTEQQEILTRLRQEGFSKEQIKAIKSCIADFNADVARLYRFIKKEHDSNSIRQLAEAAHFGLNDSQMSFLSNADSPIKLDLFKRGFMLGFSVEQVMIWSNPKFSSYQLNEIELGFHAKMDINKIRLYADVRFSEEEMRELRRKLKRMPLEEVKEIAALILLGK